MQEAQQRHLQRDLSDALLCAVINNNFRCYNESTEFAEHLDAMLAEPLKAGPTVVQCTPDGVSQHVWLCQRAPVLQGKLDIETQCRGFLVLAKSAVAHLVGTIFGDSALAELFQKLYCSEEWQQGTATGSILATLGDYFDDFRTLLEPTFFKR